MFNHAARSIWVALSFVGSAILLFSCDGAEQSDAMVQETMMTEYSENLDIVMSQNGRRSYHFSTPLVEGYTLAKEPYREFRKGVKITTYQDDSLSTVDAILTANYAIYYINRDLWEAKGNVVVDKQADQETLYTQQLFWNSRTKRIYSNVDSKIVQKGGRDVFIGEGFESDEEFSDWRFRRMKGRMEVDVTPTDNADSTASGGALGGDASPASTEPSARQTSDAQPARQPMQPPSAATQSKPIDVQQKRMPLSLEGGPHKQLPANKTTR